MTATPVQTTLEDRVLEWTEDYCEALAENYKRYHLSSLKRMYAESGSEYSRKEIEATENGTANLIRFRIQSGKKYYKVIQQDFDTFRDRNEYRDGGVHAFVDKKTGEVYKPASWKSPAKYVRYDLRIIEDRAKLHDPTFTGWAGGYLYLK
tara:strand:+ start:604 stop:1053 length:450 start_codon:yes stop_codon:yes gene_type:complete